MKKAKETLYLRQVFSRMLFFRLLIPLLMVGLIIIIAVSYLAKHNLKKHQIQVAESIANIVDQHIDHGARMLDSIARVYELTREEDLTVVMKSTWESYGYFETIYTLDEEDNITSMWPPDSRYIGLDMSNLSALNNNNNKYNLSISRPFISLRTGTPTVHLVRYFLGGGAVVGELNLGLFEGKIKKITGESNKDFVFIMDQAGTLIANPSPELVSQQTNMSNLEIFQKALYGKFNATYLYDGKNVIGSAVKIERTGWIVVNQTLLSTFAGYYAAIFAVVLILSLLVWSILILDFKKELRRYVITPLEQLTQQTNDLANGNFCERDFLNSIPTAFVEINNLLVDFNIMSNNLQTREAALRESENRYRGLVDRLPVGLFRAKLTGEILDVNPVFFSILKYPLSEDILSVNIIDFLNKASINNEFMKATEENIFNLNNFELEIKCFNEEVIWIQIDSHTVYESNEQFFEGTIQDITERIQTEMNFKKQQELLFNAEKTQREVLENALIMKDEFISLISHELKTPLNVIYSAVQLIEGVYLNQIPERVKGLIGNIKQNTFRQLRLANNLLDFTKFNSGQFKINQKNIDIVFSTKVITKSVDIYASQKDIRMSFKSNLSSKIIAIDEEKFERIILNILSNAIKFTDNGGEISVELNVDVDNNFMQIKVSDTGIGIPKDKQQLIFERFGQVDSNLSRRAEGTGIGLSLVKLLVTILEGIIDVESDVGVGSTFIITLPIKEEVIEKEIENCLDVDSRLVNEIRVQFSDIYF